MGYNPETSKAKEPAELGACNSFEKVKKQLQTTKPHSWFDPFFPGAPQDDVESRGQGVD